METLPLMPAGLATPEMTLEHARPSAALAEPSSAEPTLARVSGRAWSVRAGFARVLEQIPADAWTEPARQGWTLVKQNAVRNVWRARLGEASYFVKYFVATGFGERVKSLVRPSACRKEWNGGMFALRAGIAAVRPVAFTEDLVRDGRRCAVLITEALEPAYPLSEFWSKLQADEDVRRRREDTQQLVERLAEMIARAHQSGFEHLDMHSGNILVQPLGRRRYRTALVDLQSARLDRPVTDASAVRNLAQLNQWFRRHSSVKDRLRFLKAYFRWRNEYETEFPHGHATSLTYRELVRALVRAAGTHAERLWAQRDRRVSRAGRYFGRLRVGGGWSGVACLRCKHESEDSAASRVLFEAKWWEKQLANPMRWFEEAAGPNCKNSHSASVTRALLPHPDGGLPVIVKRPLARNWRRQIRTWIGLSRSARAFRIGHAMLHRDLPTARPLAYAERRVVGAVVDSLLITEAIPGAADLDAALRAASASLDPRGLWRCKHELCTRLVRLLRQFAANGFVHRDCKAQNILVTQFPALRLVWIDLDGVRHVGANRQSELLRALMRLHVSLLGIPGLTRGDRARVLRGVLTRFGARREAWREAWRAIEKLAGGKLESQQARREWKLRNYGRM